MSWIMPSCAARSTAEWVGWLVSDGPAMGAVGDRVTPEHSQALTRLDSLQRLGRPSDRHIDIR